MMNSFQDRSRVWAMAFLLSIAMGQNAARAESPTSDMFGRWVADDLNDKFSANGKLYRKIDIAPCGHEVCGVSADGGACGVTLFRAPRVREDTNLDGRGKWGAGEKLFVITGYGAGADLTLTFELGDKEARLGTRGSMPTFVVNYKRIGKALCTAATPSA
jgi:hypothetical protein